MKKIIGVSYFLILSFIFLLNSAEAAYEKISCFIIYEDSNNEVFITEPSDQKKCNFYYEKYFNDLKIVRIKKFPKGSHRYDNLRTRLLKNSIIEVTSFKQFWKEISTYR